MGEKMDVKHIGIIACGEELIVTLRQTQIYKVMCYSHGEGNGTPLQYSCLENPMDGGPGGL